MIALYFWQLLICLLGGLILNGTFIVDEEEWMTVAGMSFWGFDLTYQKLL